MTVLPPSRSAAAVPLRVVPSRRSPGPTPAPAGDDLVAVGDPVVGRLLVDSSYCPLSPHLRGARLAITVDGVRRGSSWGRTAIDLPPGRHLVQIGTELTAHRGAVAEMVPVAAGHVVEVFYRAPALPWSAGAIGPGPQRTRGGATLLLAALFLLLALVTTPLVLLAVL